MTVDELVSKLVEYDRNLEVRICVRCDGETFLSNLLKVEGFAGKIGVNLDKDEFIPNRPPSMYYDPNIYMEAEYLLLQPDFGF